MCIIAEPALDYHQFEGYNDISENLANLLEYLNEKEVDNDPVFDYYSMAWHIRRFLKIQEGL